MNHKETLYFIATCFTISLEEKNRQVIEAQLQANIIYRSIEDPFSFAQTNIMGTLSSLQAAWYLENTSWLDQVTSSEYKKYYHKIYIK